MNINEFGIMRIFWFTMFFVLAVSMTLTGCINPVSQFDSSSTPATPNVIAFSLDNKKDVFGIYLVNASIGNPLRITHGFGDFYPSWSPDGKKLVFSSFDTGGSRIYVVNSDGSGKLRLTDTYDDTPSWSPDGDKILFASSRDFKFPSSSEIYIMNSDGSGQTRITNNSIKEQYPHWSPDGSKILFMSEIDMHYQIYTMNTDGTNLVKLSTLGGIYPNWSPDSKKIVFTRLLGNYNQEIYIMNSEGTKEIRLTDNPAVDNWPCWSHDGKKIAFVSNRDSVPENRQYISEIYTMNADGSNQSRLTYHSYDDHFTIQCPAWSP